MSAQPKVTIPRVESWLTRNEVEYELNDDGSILTGFTDCAITITDHGGDFVSVASTWRGEFAPDTQDTVAAYVDEHNANMLGPRATVGVFDDGVVRLQADTISCTTEGMSEAQLDELLGSAFATLVSFYRTVAQDFPALVTWTKED